MEDMALLKKLEFFKGLSPIELRRLNTIVERAKFKSGEAIIREDEPSDAFYIIKEGKVGVSKGGAEITILGSGDPIGEVSFIDGGPRSATATAIEETVLIKLPMGSFESLMKNEMAMAYKIYRAIAVLLSKRLRETNESLFNMGG